MKYEVNNNGNRSFSGTHAEVARVASEWLMQGYEPKAYAIRNGDNGIECREVPITSPRGTSFRLANAFRLSPPSAVIVTR